MDRTTEVCAKPKLSRLRQSTPKPLVTAFYDKRTCSVQYVVSDPDTRRCAIIDPVLDFEPKSGATATHRADAILAHIRSEGLGLDWVLDTHPHADHISAAGYLKDKTSVRTAIGAKVVEVQRLWKGLYNLPASFPTDGSQWDKLFADGERFEIGNLDCEVLFSPGHTLASITYVVGNTAFIHDTLFMPDGGTARTDQQALDTTTPSGCAMFQLLGVFSEFERAMIRSRVVAGLNRVRGKKRLGRPPMAESKVEEVKRVLMNGNGIRETARATGASTTTVMRIARKLAAVDGQDEVAA